MPAVESVSRKWVRRVDTCSEKTNQQGQKYTISYFGSGVRTKKFNGVSIPQNYVFFRKNARTTPITADELDVRRNFSDASKWAKQAVTSLSVLTTNQQKYMQSNDEHKTCKGVWAGDYGFRGFCFAVAMAMLGNGETLPANYELPALSE